MQRKKFNQIVAVCDVRGAIVDVKSVNFGTGGEL